MVGWLKVLLFVGGGVTAAGGTAYMTGLLDPWFAPRPPAIAALPEQQPAQEPQQEATEPLENAEVTVPGAATDDTAVTDDPTVTNKDDRLLVPTFDLLRVEPDGAMLVAGKAEPGAVVDVLNGETVVASATAGAEGDFVAVADDSLAPGDYQLSLRSVSGDDVARSRETAVVSIPETPEGEVLALLDRPGGASALINVPEGREAAEPQAGSSTGEEQQVVGDPSVVEDEAVEQPTQQTAETQAPADGSTQQAAETQSQPQQPATDDTAANQQADAEQEIAQQDMAAPPGSEDQSANEPETATRTGEGSTVAQEPDAVAEAGSEQQPPAETEIAALPESGSEAAPQAAVDYRVVVEAVEIEGNTIFVAGQAAAGHSVRVYIDDMVLGDARVSDGGRFLVEARRELPVGDYLVRADLLTADGSVVARAAVPFAREPGEAIAAVAPQQQPASQQPTAQQPAQQQPTMQAPAATPESAETVTAPQVEAQDSAAAAEPEATAPALQRVDGSVIIRRGDNLWRISRRVYGQGVRYSTIYLANQDQIRNPDRIWPGQVFTVPRETAEGEQADLDAIADQLVDPDAQPIAQ